MSDDSVSAALRSDARLVVVEAPAGCGKTHQGADYARAVAASRRVGRLLILTHTHAACSVFAERTGGSGSSVEIRTIDSLIANIATAYHAGLGLPQDIPAWVRQREDGYQEVAARVAGLLAHHSMIAAAAARRYPVVICDEHQDSSGDQHAVVMALHRQGSKVAVFADPMQKIFRDDTIEGASPPYNWDSLAGQAQAFEQLDEPHRWKKGCQDLGRWTLRARDLLKSGQRIDLRSGLPSSVRVLYADNQAQANLDYRLDKGPQKEVIAFKEARPSLLVLTRHNVTARALRSVFYRTVLLWEGHTRPGLDRFVNSLRAGHGDAPAIAAAIVTFMDDVGKGFSPSAFGDRLVKEAREGCRKQSSGNKPAKIQELARMLIAEADHRGAAMALRRLWELKNSESAFADIEIDCLTEFRDAVRLGGFPTADEGLAELTNRRTYSRPKPPDKAISTIHKAKGLECDSVILMPCDAKAFPDKPDARCLLYVALTRARDRLLLVVPRNNPSPLFSI